MYRIIPIVFVLLLSTFGAAAQKTVHVREYRRKDGTIVKAHDRRPPRSSATSSAQAEKVLPTDDEQEPYTTIDLGDGSFYTPGGTGVTRPRRVNLPRN